VLSAACAARIALDVDLWHWWVPVAVIAGMLAADFASGLVHWAADTWGRDDFPILGPGLLVPFRVHHVNPDDFMTRSFVDTNGEVALAAAAGFAALLALPLDAVWGGPAAVFGIAFCGTGMATNQIHQWAHVPSPPLPIRMAQRARLILPAEAHAVHHRRPYDASYCITTGWCNRPLATVAFFKRLEKAITRTTGAQPRQDDARYAERYACAPDAGTARRA
jgi:ubiquitin-conjugating enzyme E2 variant